jgi:predicted nucleic acid-binding protein
VLVVDGAAVVDFLLREEPTANWLDDHIAGAGLLHAPHLLDFEVASALRRRTLRRELTSRRAKLALGHLTELRLVRYPAKRLLERVFELRDNLTAYDAAYIALAEALDAPLITTDGRLARSTGHNAEILSPV